MKKLLFVILTLGLVALSSCGPDGGGSTVNTETSSSSSAISVSAVDYSLGHAMNKRIGRGMNVGNALDSRCGTDYEPAYGWDGCWNNAIKEEYFGIIKAAGFQSVRIPIRWNEKATDSVPFTIYPSFIERAQEVVQQALKAGLIVVINVHHYDELYSPRKDVYGEFIDTTPELRKQYFDLQKTKFVGLWSQIAPAFQHISNDSLAFEVLNEGREQVTDGVMNELIAQVWPIIRASNPGRTILVNPSYYGRYTQLASLEVPAGDGNVILDGHFYDPMEFSHQGANGDQYPVGVTWGTKADINEVIIGFEATFQKVKAKWPGVDGGTIPINIGEFGAAMDGSVADRALYTKTVREAMEKRGMSWFYWGFAGVNFDSYDKKAGAWVPEILQALIP